MGFIMTANACLSSIYSLFCSKEHEVYTDLPTPNQCIEVESCGGFRVSSSLGGKRAVFGDVYSGLE